MSKSLKKCFNDKLTFEKLLEAHNRASIGKKQRKEVILFEMDLETNLIKMLKEIRNNNYKFGKYREFIIYEPKERLIKSLPYKDRIVHQWYIEEFIKPFFIPRFIKDTYACIENRGTHKAVLKTQKYMRKMKKENKNYYVLKCDIKKYFYNIDKKILLKLLEKRIEDKKIIEFTKIILGNINEIGIPIGNYTSQFFANIYLNEFDHYVKEKLKIKYYIRYMDDFILLLSSKKEAKNLKEEINNYLSNKLKLELNKKSCYFINYQGIDFCGYRIFETHILLRKRFKKKMKKNIYLWDKLKKEKKLNYKKMILSLNSFEAYASHSNSYNYILKIKEKIKEF